MSIVGLSEGGWAGLGESARAAVTDAEFVIGGQRHLDHLPAISGQQREAWPSPFSEGIERIRQWQGRRVCVLASGDPFWHGVGATLARTFPPEVMVCHPGPSAFSLAAARLGWPLQSVHCHSLVARDPDRLRAALAPGRRLLVLSNDEQSPETVCRLLVENGYGASRVTVLEALGGPEEQVTGTTAGEGVAHPVARLNSLAIECEVADPERPVARVPGRPGEAFVHDGQISQPEVRAVVMAKLAPRGGEHLWDLGAGSGAVAVEWLLADAANHATAVEQRPERVANVRANARCHGVGHLQVVEGDALLAMASLVRPDAVFIGGGASGEGVIEGAWSALPAGGRCVATAVTTEGEMALLAAQGRLGGQLIRLSMDHTEPLGRFNGWQSDRPITIWSATKSSQAGE
ncbi:cobalamin biosynthesis bifunctional protein CbiET [Halovibrio salipaludis]|uniref:Cobalamin biosynthesis bifunctional protein CbiET n=1 Tax=Halovibrio salipaludis TaxID=2032626 RepID=A0A2A2FCR4_9GAMM|nr:cobalamin biosynthesis bifunctional protein CbiET [Halovibrio salipaludis]